MFTLLETSHLSHIRLIRMPDDDLNLSRIEKVCQNDISNNMLAFAFFSYVS